VAQWHSGSHNAIAAAEEATVKRNHIGL